MQSPSTQTLTDRSFNTKKILDSSNHQEKARNTVLIPSHSLTSSKIPIVRNKTQEGVHFWKNIKHSTNAFLNSQTEIFRNFTTTMHNLEINQQVLDRKRKSRSMHTNGNPPGLPPPRTSQSALEGDSPHEAPDFRTSLLNGTCLILRFVFHFF